MRGYFIDSAKNLLKGEGLKSISVRNVAHHAGYSYATLYHYFKDLNELIFVCVEDFQKEAEEFIARKTKKEPSGKARLKATILAYAEYFIEYPGVFELFFLERMGDIGNKSKTADLIYTFLDRVCEESWNDCLKAGDFTPEQVSKKREQLRFGVMGMLLFYENRMSPDNYIDFMAQAKNMIDDIVG